jgi:uncharacterized delta-60 repeat protein
MVPSAHFRSALIIVLIFVIRVAGQSLDSTFIAQLPEGAAANALAIQSDGKVIVGLHFSNASNTNLVATNEVSLVRLNTDGSLDHTFSRVPHSGDIFTRTVRSVAVDTNGSVFAAGFFQVPGASLHRRIVKLNQDGTVDESFQATVDGGRVQRILLLPDGKLYVCGVFQAISGTAITNIARLQTNGAVDTSFRAAGFSGSSSQLSVDGIALQPDGRIVIGGDFNYLGGVYCGNITRLNSDGTRDASFGAVGLMSTPTPDGFSYFPYFSGVSRQEDGKVIVSGRFRGANGVLRTNIVRLETNGTVDPTFLAPAPDDYSTAIQGIVIAPDQRLFAYGSFNKYGGNQVGAMVLLNTNGSQDVAFNAGEMGHLFEPEGPLYSANPLALLIDGTGKLLLGADFNYVNGLARNTVARFTMNANPGTIQFVSTNIVTGEDDTAVMLTVTRLDGRSGTVSAQFGTSGGNAVPGLDFVATTGVVTYADGEFAPKIFSVPLLDDVVMGPAKTFNVVLSNPSNGVAIGSPPFTTVTIVASDGPGSIDSTFRPGMATLSIPYCTSLCFERSSVWELAQQSDGKIIVGGSFNPLGGPENIARLNADGSPDSSFQAGTGASDTVYALAVQPDDKILIGGRFDIVNGVAQPYLARLNADGSLDQTFVFGSGPDYDVEALALQSDGRIIVAGSFWEFSGQPLTNVVRLNTNGSIDATFVAQIGGYPSVYGMALDAQDRIYIVGDFEFVAGVPRHNIARLLPNGGLDASFVPPSGANAVDSEVYSVLPRANGKVLIGGYFDHIGGAERYGFAQLNAGGSLDATFVPPLGKPSFVESGIAEQADGKILIGGYFSDLPNEAVRRLNSDGSLDTSFPTCMTGNNSDWVSSILVQPHGSILVGGDFDRLGDFVRHNVARLVSSVPSALRVSAIDATHVRLAWPAVLSNNVVEASATLAPGTWQDLTNSPVRAGSELLVTNETSAEPKFFRLRRPAP